MMNRTKRYAVECHTPDGGYSVYAECFGLDGARGVVLGEYDSLPDAIMACDGAPATDAFACTPWIWDRLTGRIVSKTRIAKAIAD